MYNNTKMQQKKKKKISNNIWTQIIFSYNEKFD